VKLKDCDAREGGVDSCYLTSKQFDYNTENIFALIHCRGPCIFKISGSISTPYKLTPG